MKNSTIPVSVTVVCSLIILVFVTAFVTALVPVARAEGTNNTFLTDWTVAQTGGTVHVDFSPPFTLPSSIPDTSFTKGYYDDKGCPIGMTVGTKEAPRMRDAGFTSGALCRGACGPDCPTGRCKELPEIAIENRDKTGTCWYYGVIACPTSMGCQEHDSCYDYCEAHGYNFMLDSCHLQCNGRCFDKYGYTTCTKWADLPGRTGKYATKTFDFVFGPSYDQSSLTFSYPPRFLENPPTIATTPTTPIPTPTPTPPPATTVPSTTPSPTRSPTPAPTVTSGPDTRLTVIMTGDLSAEDMEGTTIGWSPEAREQSCSSTSTGGECTLKFPYGTPVEVSAFPSGNVRFIGWFGSCSGPGDCTVSMTKDKTVTAQFSKIPTTTAITNYQDYCTSNYPGSYYNAEEGTCEFQRPTPTSGTGGSNKPTLIALTGACCPRESCSTLVADATGGSPPYHFSSGTFAGGGAPPMGMIIGLDGYLSGTAPAVGTYSFSVCVADLAGNTDCGVSSIVVS